MRALVVFESMLGNTEKVAGAVARGLRLEGVDTSLFEVRSAPPHLAADVDLLVVGGPTQAFGMSRASTRADAVRQGAPSERATTGLREWLEGVALDAEHVPGLATFDTRVSKVRWLPQAAGALRVLALVGSEGSSRSPDHSAFLVDEIRGPLVERELDRAAKWGRRLGLELVDRASRRSGPVRSPGRD